MARSVDSRQGGHALELLGRFASYQLLVACLPTAWRAWELYSTCAASRMGIHLPSGSWRVHASTGSTGDVTATPTWPSSAN